MSKIVGELNAEIMKKVIHDRRAKLFAEIVAKTGSKQSVIDRAMQEIESLREQVEKMRKGIAKEAEYQQLNDGSVVSLIQEALSLPDLATPVLNRIRAEGMRMAAEICAQLTTPTKLSDPGRSWINGTLDCEKAIRARAAELENEDAN